MYVLIFFPGYTPEEGRFFKVLLKKIKHSQEKKHSKKVKHSKKAGNRVTTLGYLYIRLSLIHIFVLNIFACVLDGIS